MPTNWPEQMFLEPASGLSNSSIGNPSVEDEHFLLRAFRSFADAAGSLEQSYGRLRVEVERLRRELEKSNSDLAQSLEENRSMRAHLDRILEGLPCGVIVVAGNGQISRANPEALRLLAFNSGEQASVESVAALPAAVRRLLECARTDGGEPELCVAGETGVICWLAARHASIADSAAASASVFILRDVSERKRLEQAQAKLRREQALAEMSAVLAHEIRNPLGSLELFAGLLAEANLDADCQGWVEHVQAGLRTLAATVNNVLHFHSLPEPSLPEPSSPEPGLPQANLPDRPLPEPSLPDNSPSEAQRFPVDLGQLLGWAREFFRPLARQSQVALSLQNRVAGVFLPADRHRLEQVLLNLVLNAIRAMPGGGWIELAGRTMQTESGPAVLLVVSDTGPGIAPEHLPHIFEPGFSTRIGSPGLGLAVCRKIVEQHGGSITAGSRPGCGGIFTLTFPLAGKSSGGITQ